MKRAFRHIAKIGARLAVGGRVPKALLMLAVLSAVPPTPAADAQESPVTVARRAAGQLEAAQIALQRADGASDRVRALTQTIRAYEGGLTALRESLRGAAIREAALNQAFQAKRTRVASLLSVLQNIEASPAPLLLLHPSGPVGTARAGMMGAAITPTLQAEVDTLRSELEEITLLRALQASAADTLRGGLTEVQQARTALSHAISNRTDLPQRFLADDTALDRLIESAETLEGFASGLSGLDRAGAAAPALNIADTQNLPLPVTGTVLHRAGEADAAGIIRPGLVIATSARALVTTPWAATIRYLGPLLDYGNVIVLEPDDQHLLVLAGLEQVYGSLGQVLPAGSPVGLMGGVAPLDDTLLTQSGDETGAGRSETLYMELRQGGEPVNPAAWFALK